MLGCSCGCLGLALGLAMRDLVGGATRRGGGYVDFRGGSSTEGILNDADVIRCGSEAAISKHVSVTALCGPRGVPLTWLT